MLAILLWLRIRSSGWLLKTTFEVHIRRGFDEPGVFVWCSQQIVFPLPEGYVIYRCGGNNEAF
jgi:hypothetical protein